VTVKRWDVDNDGYPDEDERGEWVLYADHAAEVERLTKRAEEAERLLRHVHESGDYQPNDLCPECDEIAARYGEEPPRADR